MSDERVNVSKELLDNIAKLLMQATETTDNLSLEEMATAAQMMLPAKWELVVDTTLEQEVFQVSYAIKNAEEVHIEVTADTPIAPKASTNALYAKLWGADLIVQNALSNSIKTIVIHGQKIGDDVVMNYGPLSNFNAYNYQSTRIGAFISKPAINNTIGFYTSSVNNEVSFVAGTRVRIWAKRRMSANE